MGVCRAYASSCHSGVCDGFGPLRLMLAPIVLGAVLRGLAAHVSHAAEGDEPKTLRPVLRSYDYGFGTVERM